MPSAQEIERALLDTALSVIMDSVAERGSAVVGSSDPELADGKAAVVVVLHHVLADGLGGLNVLAALVDPGVEPAGVPFPRPSPPLPILARDAFADAAPRDASGGRLLAVPAPSDVRWWRLSARPRRYLALLCNGRVPGWAWRLSGWSALDSQRRRIGAGLQQTMRFSSL